MKKDIPTIQTLYDGVEFRSRLEARWAVFFNSIGVKWIYEPEGFDLDENIKYLPDFYLPYFESYFEVKPFDIETFNSDLKILPTLYKPAMLASKLDRPVYVGGNFPVPNVNIYEYIPLILQVNPENIDTANFLVKDCCEMIDTSYLGTEFIDYYICDKNDSVCPRCKKYKSRTSIPYYSIIKARSAKFEHGKKG